MKTIFTENAKQLDFGIGAAAIMAGAALAGQAGQMTATKLNNTKNWERTQKLLQQQTEASKQLAMFNRDQQLELWKATGPVGQMEQLKKAGLNPGLIYGGQGSGGQTANAAQASLPNAQEWHGENPGANLGAMGIQLGQQLALQKAQIENIQADTKNKLADATKTSGVDTELGKTQILSLTQGIANQKATEALTQVQKQIQDVELQIKGATAEQTISLVSQQSQIAEQTIRSLVRENAINARTAHDRIRMVNAELMGQIAHNNLTEQLTTESAGRVKLNEQQIKNLQNEITIRLAQKEQGWNSIEMNWNAINQNIRQSINQIRNANITDQEKMTTTILENILKAF